MRILYGVVGEGMGHATRSRVVLEHLRARGHEVRIIASHNAARLLDRHFGAVLPIEGMRMVFGNNNRVRRYQTLASVLAKTVSGLPRNLGAYFELVHQDFEPDVVLSDFESWTHIYALTHGLPILSIDNNHIVNRCSLVPDLVQRLKSDFRIADLIVRSKLPFCDHYFVTSFFRPPIKKPRTSLHAPVLRPEVLAADPSRGEHLLVYQSAGAHESLVDALRGLPVESRVYGMWKGLDHDVVQGKVRFRPFDERRFVEDLASCRAVIATGGATLMSEAVHLGKPMLSLPISGQFEQAMNAAYLEKEGFGMAADAVDLPTLRGFLHRLDAYERSLESYERVGNADLLRAVDDKLKTLVPPHDTDTDTDTDRREPWALAA